MRIFRTWSSKFFLLIATLAILVSVNRVFAASSANQVCPRYTPGSTLIQPKDLFSSSGALMVNFKYQTRVDAANNVLYCFTDDKGNQSPTLHVKPGDKLILNVLNLVPSGVAPSLSLSTSPGGRTRYRGMVPMPGMNGMSTSGSVPNCSPGVTQDSTSVNIHNHGTVGSPVCHQDEVITTLINSGQTFRYEINIPPDQPSGLLWYHPHIHGNSESAVLGGSSGALIVDGLEQVNPAIAGLPQQVMIFRDNLVPGNPTPGGAVPSWDLSLNYTPVPYPNYPPVVVPMKPLEKQFWRVANASADTILDIELDYDGVAQPLQVVALDGVGINSQDGTQQGSTITQKHILLGPANRAEFIIIGPGMNVKSAILRTNNVDTGPVGDNDPTRPLAVIQANAYAQSPPVSMPNMNPNVAVGPQRFAGLSTAVVTTKRKLYFSEILSDPTNPASPTNFYITVDGATPVLFNTANPPSITTTQGSVEQWTVENRSQEDHIFHIHQSHFLVTAQNGVPVGPLNGRKYQDSILIPYWSGKASDPYPSVTFKINFKGNIAGDFVYHCHILGHEDNGMMAIIQVNPS